MVRQSAGGGGGGDVVRVQPEELNAAARKADSIGEAFADDVRFCADEARAAVDAHTDWKTGYTLSFCQGTWEYNVHTFATQVSDVAEKLRENARNYVGSDENSADGFRQGIP